MNNTLVGNGTTDSAGVASLTYTVPLSATLGSQSVRVEFAGDSIYADATSTTTLEVLPVRVQGQVALQGVSDPQGIPVRFTLTQGNQQQQLDITLSAGGSFTFDTTLAGMASVRVSTPNGVWLCAQTDVALGELVTLNFSLRAGDLNQDGTINNADLLLVLFTFGTNSPQADANRDGVVNNADLLLVLFNFGAAC
ncbi:MAG: hypothetical protein NZ550_01475 [Fimbriimonadales bacterium]|nr:hypothetical protein [Fimbriimonadales bacterium]MDW8052098.1 hypothetical protein [Armatimonadota bacterium]